MNERNSRWGNVAGVFLDAWDLKSALDELGYLGFSASQIGVATDLASARQIEAMGDSPSRSLSSKGTARRLLSLSRTCTETESALLAGTLAANLSHFPDSDLTELLCRVGVDESEAREFVDEFHHGHSIVTVNAGIRAPIAAIVLKRVRTYS